MLFDCLSSVMAWERLQDPQQVSQLEPDGFFDLCQAAGYDRETAGKFTRDLVRARFRQRTS